MDRYGDPKDWLKAKVACLWVRGWSDGYTPGFVYIRQTYCFHRNLGTIEVLSSSLRYIPNNLTRYTHPPRAEKVSLFPVLLSAGSINTLRIP